MIKRTIAYSGLLLVAAFVLFAAGTAHAQMMGSYGYGGYYNNGTSSIPYQNNVPYYNMAGYGYGYGPMMGYENPLGWVLMLLFWVLLVIGVIMLMRWMNHGHRHGWHDHGHSAIDVLRDRYAKGKKPALATMGIVTTALALIVGWFAKINMGPGNHANCLAAIPGSPECVGGMNPVQFAMMHINTLLGASLGIVGSLATALLLSLLVLLAWITTPDAADLMPAFSSHTETFIEGVTRSVRRQRRWISLLEKRAPSPFRAMNA